MPLESISGAFVFFNSKRRGSIIQSGGVLVNILVSLFHVLLKQMRKLYEYRSYNRK